MIKTAIVKVLDPSCCMLPDIFLMKEFPISSFQRTYHRYKIYFRDEGGEEWYGCRHCLDIIGVPIIVNNGDCCQMKRGLYTAIKSDGITITITDGKSQFSVCQRCSSVGLARTVANLLPIAVRSMEEYKALAKFIAPIDIKDLDAEPYEDSIVFGSAFRAKLMSGSLRGIRYFYHGQGTVNRLKEIT